ncbi:hypothetical protein LOAG_09229 [Loa loa]|uniref:Uncharacterized protein n=1 Tax=Loa loa TaxID=7209 RepID=A0A1S0TS34_LOALO|nr:hypothetical protein LOAG_09229 [Loa loa]EFO19266.1 hypothetical protein LOAG_09229 [Loa loa]
MEGDGTVVAAAAASSCPLQSLKQSSFCARLRNSKINKSGGLNGRHYETVYLKCQITKPISESLDSDSRFLLPSLSPSPCQMSDSLVKESHSLAFLPL